MVAILQRFLFKSNTISTHLCIIKDTIWFRALSFSVEIGVGLCIAFHDQPTNRCDFDTINMTYIGSHVGGLESLLYQIPRSWLLDLPCEILVQLAPDLLDSKNVSYLIDPEYWFSDNDNETEPRYLSCNISEAITCPIGDPFYYRNISAVSNSDESDECYLGTDCLYPLVPSKYNTNYPGEGTGMCYCGLDCRLTNTKMDMDTFDSMMSSLCVCCIIALSVYSINVLTEYQSARANRKSEHDHQSSSLSMDIPPIIGVFLFLYLCCFNGPYFTGLRSTFICEDQSSWNSAQTPATPAAKVGGDTLWKSNKLCFVFGAMTYFLMLLMINYFCLLSFVIYRYVAEPLKPLWSLRKEYFHLTVIMYSAIYLLVLIVNGKFTSDSITGTCVPNFGSLEVMICVAVPYGMALVCFSVCTPLTVYHLNNHAKYTKNRTLGKCLVDKNLVNLYRRLIVYTLIVALGGGSFTFVAVSAYALSDERSEVGKRYLICLITKFIWVCQIGENLRMKAIIDHLLVSKPDCN